MSSDRLPYVSDIITCLLSCCPRLEPQQTSRSYNSPQTHKLTGPLQILQLTPHAQAYRSATFAVGTRRNFVGGGRFEIRFRWQWDVDSNYEFDMYFAPCRAVVTATWKILLTIENQPLGTIPIGVSGFLVFRNIFVPIGTKIVINRPRAQTMCSDVIDLQNYISRT